MTKKAKAPPVFRWKGAGGRSVHRPGGWPPAGAFPKDKTQNPFVHRVEPSLVDLQHLQGLVCHGPGNFAIRLHLGKIPHPAKQAVCDPGGPPGPACQLFCGRPLDFNFEDPARAPGHECQFLLRVIIDPLHNAEAGTQGGRQKPAPGRGPDQGKAREVDLHGAGAWALVDHDVDHKLLHRRVKVFLHDVGNPVNLIHKKDVALLEVRQNSGQIPGPFQDRARSRPKIGAHFPGNDVGQGRLPQTGRAEKKEMVQRLLPLTGRLDKEFEIFL